MFKTVSISDVQIETNQILECFIHEETKELLSMTVTLPSAKEWLYEQLKRAGITQNELGRRAGMAGSAVTNFAKGEAGAKTCLDIARGLDVNPLIPLALCGHVPPPASWASGDFESLAVVWHNLDNRGRDDLLSFAHFMLKRQREAN